MMYIEIHNWKIFEQELLYFKLNNSINLNTNIKRTYKMAGIYAIYKGKKCVYVGQSMNLASRTATHLRGKYQNCTNIYMWNIESLGYKDFINYKKEIQEQILIRAEKYLMSILKPIDNIDIDMDFMLYTEIPTFNFNSSSSYTIQVNDDYLQITDSRPYFVDELILRLRKEHLETFLSEITPIQDFYFLGVKDEKSI